MRWGEFNTRPVWGITGAREDRRKVWKAPVGMRALGPSAGGSVRFSRAVELVTRGNRPGPPSIDNRGEAPKKKKKMKPS